jgi:hypothetical protein
MELHRIHRIIVDISRQPGPFIQGIDIPHVAFDKFSIIAEVSNEFMHPCWLATYHESSPARAEIKILLIITERSVENAQGTLIPMAKLIVVNPILGTKVLFYVSR